MSRFSYKASEIDIPGLERKTRPLFYFCLLLSVIFHALIAVIIEFRQLSTVAEVPLPVDLIFQHPRRPRPPVMFYNTKLPSTRREYIYHRIPSTPPMIAFPSIPLPGYREKIMVDLSILDKMMELLRPDYSDSLGSTPEMPYIDTENIMASVRRPSNESSMQEELVRIEDYAGMENTGYERGVIFYNPTDKHSISGLVYLGTFSSNGSARSKAMEFLAEGIEKYTDIKAVLSRPVLLNSRNTKNPVSQFPFIHLACAETWEYLPTEVTAVKKVVESGGFIMLENIASCVSYSPADASFRAFIKEVFGSSARIAIIPQDHPLYHSYFDFDEVPLGNEYSFAKENNIASPEIKFYLEGIWIKERLVGILSNKGYCEAWVEENYPAIRMGVNILVYAMRRTDGNVIRRVDNSLTKGSQWIDF